MTPATTIKTGFPHYRGIWPFRFRAGWKDLGESDTWLDETCKEDEYIVEEHSFCHRAAHVGRDADGSLFRFCPRCLVKTNSAAPSAHV